ncbi:squamous cell carcinoma antigen recognized by T-cells 3-like isoform X3 [Halichondria panicea]
METASPNLVELRKTFKRARDSLEALYGKDGDPTDSLSRYQASLEARCYDNMETARALWVEVMSRYGKQAQYWIEYASIERSHGDTASCRKVLQRASNSASDDPEMVCEALLQFERESGDLESFEGALVRCEAQLDRVRARREKAAEKDAFKKDDLKKHRKMDIGKGRVSSRDKGQSLGRKRPPPGREMSDDQQPAVKKQKFVAETGIVQLPSKKVPTVEAAKVETEGPKEARTVFVSNLSFKATEDELREIFTPCGLIAEIRLIRTRQSNKGNVYAYVEFATPDPVASALGLDKTEIEGRPMYVSQFKEKGRPVSSLGDKTPQRSDSKATVFVSHIAHHITDQELREHFQQCGEIKEVRLIKNREGRSKGFAYIEFTDESSANVAVARLNNSDELGMKRMSVAISNPPKGGSKGTFGGPEPETGFKRPTFAPRDMQDNNPIVTSRRKTNIPLLPRALAKRAVSGDKNTTSSTSGEGNKLSNDDFRKLLAKK